METKYTPGPWRQDSLGGTSIWAEPRGGACIADCEADSFSGRAKSRPLDERVANARLISAAPELLKALEDCITAYEQHRDGQPTGHLWNDPNHIFYARAAIAKATGDEGAQQQAEQDEGQLAADVEAACTLLEAKEYAEHWAATELGKRLEAALTELHNDAHIQRDALHAVAEAVAEETTSWVANQHTLGVPNDAPDLDAIIDRVMAERGCL